jgi:hypothetical protein
MGQLTEFTYGLAMKMTKCSADLYVCICSAPEGTHYIIR